MLEFLLLSLKTYSSNMISRLATTEMNIEACNIITPCNAGDGYKSFRTIH